MYFIDIESVSYTIDGKSINACVNFKVFGGLEMRLQRYYFFLKCTNFSERFFRLYGNRSTLCCETPKNILDGSLFGQILIHLEETCDAFRFGGLTGNKTVGLHDRTVVVLMGSAEFRRHGHFVVKIRKGAVGIFGAFLRYSACCLCIPAQNTPPLPAIAQSLICNNLPFSL